MSTANPGDSFESILSRLTQQAKELLGEERAAVQSSALQATAQQIWEVSQAVPAYELEPGFYQ